MQLERLRLISNTVTIFQKLVSRYVGSHPSAAKAQRKVREASAGKGDTAFHYIIDMELNTLQTRLDQIIDPTRVSDKAFEDAVDELLEAFEDVCMEPPDDRFADEEFPKIATLHHCWALYNEGVRKFDLKWHRCLYCPSWTKQESLQDAIAACSQQLQAILDFSKTLNQIESVQEWDPPICLSKYARGLHKTVSKHLRCDCNHLPRFGFTDSMRYAVDSCHYRFCFSGPVSSTNDTVWNAAKLVISEPNVRIDARNELHFEESDDETNNVEEQHWIVTPSLCQLLHRKDARLVIHISNDECKACEDSDTRFSRRLKLVPMAQMLACLKPVERHVLAVILAYHYLHLYGTDWWLEQEVNHDLWLAYDEIGGTAIEQPFFAFTTRSKRAKASRNEVESFEKRLNLERPSLPAFGKLLLEIQAGKPLEWGTEFETALANCKNEALGHLWHCAIDACTSSKALKEVGSIKDSLREYFVARVIKSLQWVLEEGCHLTIDNIFTGARSRSLVQGLPTETGESAEGATLDPPTFERAQSLCLNDGEEDWVTVEEKIAAAARSYFSQLDEGVQMRTPRCMEERVKIAILDTGARFDKKALRIYNTPPRASPQYRTWVTALDIDDDVLTDGQEVSSAGDDNDGHGTYLTSAILRVDSYSEVYVAKVFETAYEKQSDEMNSRAEKRVARAIDYAINKWKVDIISLSFGFDREVECISAALKQAEDSNILVFAAPSNGGGTTPITWPARLPTVISMFAADGYCNPYYRNPDPRPDRSKFATLGCEVKVLGRFDEYEYRSGTSVATALGAGIASLVIRFMRQEKMEYLKSGNAMVSSAEEYDDLLKRLTTYTGMSAVFDLMVITKRGGYDFVAPWLLFGKRQKSRYKFAIVEDILNLLQNGTR